MVEIHYSKVKDINSVMAVGLNICPRGVVWACFHSQFFPFLTEILTRCLILCFHHPRIRKETSFVPSYAGIAGILLRRRRGERKEVSKR
jgi:hypothetical protein